jgi:choline dehydrogenase-like flavoprotein
MFPYQVDMNAGSPIGVGWIQQSVGDGQRSSSATSYLAPKFLARPNLAVLVNAEVTKLVKVGFYLSSNHYLPEAF